MVREKIHKQVFPMFFFVLLCLYMVSLIVPAVWVLLTSLKGRLDFIANPFGLPQKWKFSNYIDVFGAMSVSVSAKDGSTVEMLLPRLFFNAIVFAVLSTIVTTLSHCVTAYVVAKYRFRFGRILYATVIVTMILPIVGNLPSMLQLMNAIGFYDNLFGLIIMKASFTGTNFLIFYATFRSISWEYAEAAFIDGASHAHVMFRIMIPLAKTTVLALALITFIGYWNDWQTTMIYMPNFPTAAYALYNFQFNTDNATAGVPYLMTACIMVMVPVLVLFLIFRNKLMGAIAVGGLKG